MSNMYHSENDQSSYTHPLAGDVRPSYQASTSVDEPNRQIWMTRQDPARPQGAVQATPWSSHFNSHYEISRRLLDNHSIQSMTPGHGSYNSLSQGSWVPEQSNLRAVDGEFPPPPRIAPALSSSHQPWDGTNAHAQIAPSDPVQVSPLRAQPLGRATLTLRAPDPVQRDTGRNFGEIAVPVNPCPEGYVKLMFDNETTNEIAQKFGIADDCVFYYSHAVDESVDCVCPIIDCGLGWTTFKGHTIKDHLRCYHPRIAVEEAVVCARKSHKTSKCPIGNTVQGRYYGQHFEEKHLDVHYKCPFCDRQCRRADYLRTDHFDKCKGLKKALTMPRG